MAQKQTVAFDLVLTGDQAIAELKQFTDQAEKSEKAVEGLNNANKTLKQQLKEATNEAQILSQKFGENSKEALAAQKRVAQLKEEISDFKDRVDSLNPEAKFAAFGKVASGIAGSFSAATGAAALFGGESEDLQKALLKVQAALAITQGINEMRGLGDALKNAKIQAGEFSGKLEEFIKNKPFSKIGEGIKSLYSLNPRAFFVGIGVALLAIGSYIKSWITGEEELQKQIQKSREIEETRFYVSQKGYEREIELAKELGKETTTLERKRTLDKLDNVKKRIALADQEFENEVQKANSVSDLYNSGSEEGRKRRIQESEDLKKRVFEREKMQQELLDIEYELQRQLRGDVKETLAVVVKANEDQFKSTKDRIDAQEKAEKDALDRKKKAQQQINDELKESEERVQDQRAENNKKQIETTERVLKESTEAVTATTVEQVEITVSAYEKLEHATSKLAEFLNGKFGQAGQAVVNTVAQNLQTVGTFYDAAEARQLKAAEGNEAKQEQIRKKYFEKNKKLQKAQATISMFTSAVEAYKSTVGVPIVGPILAPIAAAGAIVAGIANIRKIDATSYNGGGDAGGGSPGGGGGAPDVSFPAPPPVNGDDGQVFFPGQPNGNQNQGQQPGTMQPVIIQNNIVASEVQAKNDEINAAKAGVTYK